MFLFLGRIYGIIVAGGSGSSAVDFLTGDLGFKLPTLHKNVFEASVFAHNGTILLCGGKNNEKRCLQMDHGTWKEHSTLNKKRVWHSAVTTQVATFLFGGYHSNSKTYEYLPKDSTKWLMGKTEIPGRFTEGYAIAVKSEQEIWLIGGVGTQRRILSFNVKNHTFQVSRFQLNVERWGQRCYSVPNTNKIMITGGYSDGFLDSTEMLDTEEGTVTMASPMNSKRYGHGMGVVTINAKDRLAVFGGFDGKYLLDSVELYKINTEKWEMTGFKLSKARSGFGSLTIKLGDILSES